MNKIALIALLLFPIFASAQVWPLPDSSKYIDDITNSLVAPKKIWTKFILPNGLPYWAEQIVFVPVAKAEELNLKEAIKEYIRQMAENYGVSTNQLIALAECESQLNTNLWGDQHRSYGLFQYFENTFLAFQELSGIEGEWKDWRAQSQMTAWAWSKGFQKHWFNCYYFLRFNKWPK